jgi:exodeoxyribonuclease V alpha subunit
VVVDETSMVSLTMMARLLNAVRPSARLVLVGDPDQLASVEAGAVLGDLARADGRAEPALDAALAATGLPAGVVNGVVTLDHVWRYGDGIAAFARAVQAGAADTAVALLRSGHDDLVLADPGDLDAVRCDVRDAGTVLAAAAREGRVEDALAALESHRVLCAHRRGRWGVARWAAQIERWLGGTAAQPWYPGRPVLVTANDYDTGLFNGDTGVVVARPEGLRVAFARGGPPSLYPPSRLSDVETVHAMTVHRGQGSQFGRVTVVLPPAESPLLTRELLYTAVTRAREFVRIVGTEDAVRAAIERPVARASGLRQRLTAGPDQGLRNPMPRRGSHEPVSGRW